MTDGQTLQLTQRRAVDLAATYGAAAGMTVCLVKGHLGILPPFVPAPCTVRVIGIFWLAAFRETGAAEHVLVQVHDAEKMRGGHVRLDQWRESTACRVCGKAPSENPWLPCRACSISGAACAKEGHPYGCEGVCVARAGRIRRLDA